VEAIVNACMHPLLEIDHGITKLTHDTEKRNANLPVTEAFKKMGADFAHFAAPEHPDLAAVVQAEIDRRW